MLSPEIYHQYELKQLWRMWVNMLYKSAMTQCYNYNKTNHHEMVCIFNILKPRQNGCHFSDDIFICNLWKKMYEFWLTFHWSLFLGVKLTIFQNWLRLWLGAWSAPNHYLNQWCLVYWHICVSLGINELNRPTQYIQCVEFTEVLIYHIESKYIFMNCF